jgi:hypothetical protein
MPSLCCGCPGAHKTAAYCNITMSSSSAPRKPATASDSAATSKRPAEERAGDAKRRLGGDDPATAKFAIQDDAGHILAVYESEGRAYAALLNYNIVDYPVSAAETEPEPDLLSAAASAAPTKKQRSAPADVRPGRDPPRSRLSRMHQHQDDRDCQLQGGRRGPRRAFEHVRS